MIVFLNCASNNKAQTVLHEFLSASQRYRLPLKVRTDHGDENVLVARHLLETCGVSSKPDITGKSVHNQQIERLWVDVYTRFQSVLECVPLSGIRGCNSS